MRPGSVEVMHIRARHAVELLLKQDEQMIEAFTPYTAKAPLTDGIRAWGVRRSFKNLNGTRLRNSSEAQPKLVACHLLDQSQGLYRDLWCGRRCSRLVL